MSQNLLKSDLKSPGYDLFEANLTHFVAKSGCSVSGVVLSPCMFAIKMSTGPFSRDERTLKTDVSLLLCHRRAVSLSRRVGYLVCGIVL